VPELAHARDDRCTPEASTAAAVLPPSALEALADAGFLGRIAARDRTCYRLEPSLEHWDTLERLVICYEDPLRRERIYELVHLADRERQFRAIAAAPYELAYGG
jgi:hypothetical protein